MRELLRVVEEPRQCPYLDGRSASLEYRLVIELTAVEYANLLARGYRRFGHQLFRPSCASCQDCVSLRILVGQFRPTRGQRRVLSKNRRISVRPEPLYATPRHIELFNLYQAFMSEHRRWKNDAITMESYIESFVVGGDGFGSQWLFHDGETLVGVALMDETPDAISLVYFFHHPAWRPAGPGVFSVLTQLAHAKRRNLNYAYPGYWIADNSSMNYKSRYRPYEKLLRHPGEHETPRWLRQDELDSAAALRPSPLLRESFAEEAS